MYRPNSKTAFLIVGLLSVMLSIVACGTEANKAYAVFSEPSINVGQAVPPPQGEVILTMSGNMNSNNSGADLAFDMQTLEKVGLIEYTIDDPWQDGQQVTYTGVLVSELLKVAGLNESATSLHLIALDDYAVDIPISEINQWPVMLATRRAGQYMGIDASGPTQIVFPFHSNPEIDKDTYKVQMIWNLRDIEIR